MSAESKSGLPDLVPCLIIGGAADGAIMPVKPEALYIELGRPTHIKPLASKNAQPEAAREKDVYLVHTFGVPSKPAEQPDKNPQVLYAVAVLANRDIQWAMNELMVGYVQHVTNQHIAQNLHQSTETLN